MIDKLETELSNFNDIVKNYDEMEFLIGGLTPHDETYVGRAFMLKVLKEEGVQGLIACVEKIHKIMTRDNKLQMYDFKDPDKELHRYYKYFKEIGVPQILLYTKREFFLELASLGVGALFTGLGLVNLVKNMRSEWRRYRNGEPVESDSGHDHDMLDHVVHHTNTYGYPIAEAAGGVLAFAAGVTMWKTEKLDQVQNAISEMIKRQEEIAECRLADLESGKSTLSHGQHAH
jgi:hypothetical protein